MTSRAARCLALLCVLFITACDGGIFGTGGPDDMLNTEVDASIPNEQAPNSGADAATSGSMTAGEGSSTSGTTGGTTGGTAGGTSGGITDGDTESQPDTGTSTSANSTADSAVTTGGGDAGRFVNNTPTLADADARINVINTTSLTLNVFETSVEPSAIVFDATGIAPSMSSSSVMLTTNPASIVIVDNNNVAETLVTYTEFDAADATLTTFVVRQNDAEFSAIALATEIQTTDPMLAKLRVVQAGNLGDASVSALIQLQSTGPNPGGISNTFGPISYALPATTYIELPAGDYELIDAENRISTEVLSLSGGTVYTAILVGEGTNSILMFDESELSQSVQ